MRVLLYASVDLNLIDGSAIWLTSLAEVFAQNDDTEVDILLRVPLQRTINVENLKNKSNVTIINPWEDTGLKKAAGLISIQRAKRLNQQQAFAVIKHLAYSRRLGLILVRDDAVAAKCCRDSNLASRLWCYITDPARNNTADSRDRLKLIAKRCHRLLFQTEQAKDYFISMISSVREKRIALLPPMLPNFGIPSNAPLGITAPKLVYSGKFSPGYRSIEMFSVFERIRERYNNAEFHIIGDKFYNRPPVENFEKHVRNNLSKPGVIWHGAKTRQEVFNIIAKCDFAFCWRTKDFDTNVELSTKMLEYAAQGVLPLLNPTPVQISVFGSAYPGYIYDENSFLKTIEKLINDLELFENTRNHCQQVAETYTYAHTLARLKPHLKQLPKKIKPETNSTKKQTILIAGHRFHFLNPIIESFNANFQTILIDKWQGHRNYSVSNSQELLNKADIIFCEWCLGNAVFYSKNKKPHQRLIVRLHAMEMRLEYLNELNWPAVDALITICPLYYNELRDLFPQYKDRVYLVFNALDTSAFSSDKLAGSNFNLGFIGMVPKQKNLRLAIEILQKIRRIDSRYSLSILGKMPEDYPWMRSRANELTYYRTLFEYLSKSKDINAIQFDGFTTDVPGWFEKIGFLLSTSDHEGSHQAVAEAMASGSIPIIRNWKGAELLYPEEYVFCNPEEAVDLILHYSKSEYYEVARQKNRLFAMQNFDVKKIIKEILSIII
jgi:glycosyltransferase involved in cell wall biosynthesis